MILSIDAVCFFLKMMSEILVRKEKFENKIKSNFKGKQKVRRERKLFDVKLTFSGDINKPTICLNLIMNKKGEGYQIVILAKRQSCQSSPIDIKETVTM
jgi:hypothetical protein